MEIKAIKTFIVVAECGTISHAATILHCVQSNVTSRIKALEEELGEALFLRSRSGMALTAAGELFLPYAREVLASEAEAAAAIKGFSKAVRYLRLGSMETTLAVRLPPFLATFRAAYPAAKITVRSGSTDDLVAQILNKELDVAFIGGPFPHPDIHARTVFREEMVLVTDTSITNSGQTGSSPVMVFREGCSYRAFTRQWMRNSGLAPNEVFELGTLDGILGCTASGLGVTFLPRSVVETSRHRSHVNIHTLEGPDRFIDTYVIQNIKAAENGAAAKFIDLACEKWPDRNIKEPQNPVNTHDAAIR